jgi:hypothetical protein
LPATTAVATPRHSCSTPDTGPNRLCLAEAVAAPGISDCIAGSVPVQMPATSAITIPPPAADTSGYRFSESPAVATLGLLDCMQTMICVLEINLTTGAPH